MMIGPELLLGIDGGGSKTVALLSDRDGRILGNGLAGASNHNVVGFAAASAELDRAIDAAFVGARIEPCLPLAICLGMAGLGRPDDLALFRAWSYARWPGAHIAIANDAELVLAAGTPAGWGLALICGTGSIAYGRDAGGLVARAGGWGYVMGDEGSGYAIGLAALRAITRAADGRGPRTLLTSLVLGHWSLSALKDLIPKVYREPASTAAIAGLAGLVDAAAADGDAVARQILHAACYELALALNAVAEQLALPMPVACALAGSLLARRPALVAGVLVAAAELGLAIEPATLVEEPATGALQLAARLLDDNHLLQ